MQLIWEEVQGNDPLAGSSHAVTKLATSVFEFLHNPSRMQGTAQPHLPLQPQACNARRGGGRRNGAPNRRGRHVHAAPNDGLEADMVIWTRGRQGLVLKSNVLHRRASVRSGAAMRTAPIAGYHELFQE